jgi:hypothetical protein
LAKEIGGVVQKFKVANREATVNYHLRHAAMIHRPEQSDDNAARMLMLSNMKASFILLIVA